MAGSSPRAASGSECGEGSSSGSSSDDGEAELHEGDERPAILAAFYAMELRRLERLSTSRLHKDPSFLVMAFVLFCLLLSSFFARWGQLSLPIQPRLLALGRQCQKARFLQRKYEQHRASIPGEAEQSSCMHVVLQEPLCLPVMMWPANASLASARDCACCARGVNKIGVESSDWDLWMPDFNPGSESPARLSGSSSSFWGDLLLAFSILLTVVIVALSCWVLLTWSETPFLLSIISLTMIFVTWWMYCLLRHGRQVVCTSTSNEVNFGVRDPPLDFASRLLEWAYVFFCLTSKGPRVTDAEKTLLITYVSCLAALALVYLLVMRLRPALLRHMCRRGVGARWWWDVRREPDRYGAVCFTYNTMGPLCPCNRRAYFTYSGEVDDRGRPHGLGQWTDDSYHGECLHGYWVGGRPARRFQSRETGTGARFAMRPIGYVAHRADCPAGSLSEGSCFVRREELPRCGVVQVECSMAGGFFPFLPACRDESEQDTVDDMIEAMKVEICGTVGLHRTHADDRALGRDPSRPLETPELEALVFVHGWQADMATAVQKLAMTTILGKMRPHIVPFVFGWSAGGLLTIHTVRNHSREYGGDLAAFFAALARHFREVHVLTHSMGAHFWLANFPAVRHCFAPHRRNKGAALRHEEGKLHLATVTFLNGAVLVEEVVESLPEVLDFADHFTAYNDTGDVANLMDQLVNMAVPRSWSPWRPPRGRGEGRARTLNFGRVVSPLWLRFEDEELREGPGATSSLAKSARLQGPLVDRAAGNFSWRAHRQGAPLPPLLQHSCEAGRCIWGCIDMVDCSHIEANAAFSRHNYYAVNSLVVEDICELISRRLRAGERSHLVLRDGNVYDFLSAPAALTM